MLDSDWLPRTEGVAETSRQCIKIWSREPKADSRIGDALIKIGSREPKAKSKY